MTRGNTTVTKVHYQGKSEDFIVFIESVAQLEAWEKDSSIPLAQVVESFQVLVTHKHGAQGRLDSASKSTLENEFGTTEEDKVIKQILTKGTVQTSETPGRGGDRNDSIGARVAH
ncbi:hypothetical protein DV735_g4087, partial [Chaetothyriales sp. CBS 134920]